MTFGEWLANFRRLHERSRQGQLSPREHAIYRAGRDDLARAMVAAQRLALKPGETPRKALRVARALQVDFDFPTSHDRAVTLDICSGGFSCLLSKAPSLGEEAGFELRVPASEPLRGRARVSDVNARGGNVRVAFTFSALEDADRERLETFVFDTVLGALTT